MTFQFIDLLLFPAIGQGLVMAFLLWRLPSTNQPINQALAIFLALASSLLIGRVLLVRVDPSLRGPFGLLADTAIFLFGPLLYQFLRRLSNRNSFTLGWYHFLPAFTHFLIVVYFATIGNEYYLQSKANGVIMYWYGIIELVGLILNLTYWIIGCRVIYSANRQNNLLVYHTQRSQRFLNFTLGLLGLGFATWLANTIAGWGFRTSLPFISYHTLWLCLASFTYMIGISMLVSPQLYQTIQLVIANQLEPKRERLKSDERDELAARLDQLMVEKELFRNGDLTQKQLAETLGATVHNLSWMLNQHYQKTFFEYINHLRLQAFLSQVEAGEHQRKTLLALALDSGFSSKSTFNRVFKEQYHCSPTQYIAQLAA
ncbi:MAG: helix-turn-helix domain-containing protein [Bacteroidota bacterium]